MLTECVRDQASAADGPRKALYLRGGADLRVTLDGPALRVQRPARAVQWYPLARLSRVLSARAVRWDSRALLACADIGVPVAFVDRGGRVLGLLVGSTAADDDLFWRLCAMANQPTGTHRYGVWRDTMERHVLRVVARQTRLTDVELSAEQWRQRLAEEKGRYAPRARWEAIEQCMAGLVTALSAELLAAIGLNATRLALLSNGLSCLDDLAGLLGWALQWPVLDALRARAHGEVTGDGDEDAHWVALFEAQVPDLRRLGQRLLECLEQVLAG
jgi:hypothetical protein